jgi:hypothetical protein
MLRIFILLPVLMLLLQSCQSDTQKEPFKTLLKDCDQVDIVYYNGGDSLFFNTRDSAGVKILTHSISGDKITQACPPTGELRYKVKDQTVLTAQFSTTKSSNKEKCDVVSYQLNAVPYTDPLPEKAVILLNEVYKQGQKPQPPTTTK